MEKVINVNNVDIPFAIKTIKRAKSVKMFIRDNVLVVTKPFYVSKIKVQKIILENKKQILEMYLKGKKVDLADALQTPIEILYNGKLILLIAEKNDVNKIKVNWHENEIVVHVDNTLEINKQKEVLNDVLYTFFKRELDAILKEKLEYYSKLLNVNYSNYTIRKMSTKYGSCNTKTKRLNFNVNLIYMPENVRDMIIVHELSHLIYPNHSKEFYNILKSYIKDYDECKMWLKNNSRFL